MRVDFFIVFGTGIIIDKCISLLSLLNNTVNVCLKSIFKAVFLLQRNIFSELNDRQQQARHAPDSEAELVSVVHLEIDIFLPSLAISFCHFLRIYSAITASKKDAVMTSKKLSCCQTVNRLSN